MPAFEDFGGLGHHARDDRRRGRDVVDQGDGLAGDDGGDVEIPRRFGRAVLGGDRVDVLQHLHLPAAPAADLIVDEAAPGERLRPHGVAGNVEDDAADRIAALGGADRRFASSKPSASTLA